MILQALKEYYDRKAADPESGIAPLGWEKKELPFLITLAADGSPVGIEDTREPVGKKLRAKSFLVPQAVKRTVGMKANLLWDDPEYALAMDIKDAPDKAAAKHTLFIRRIEEGKLADIPDISAVMTFLKRPYKLEMLALLCPEAFDELKKLTPAPARVIFEVEDIAQKRFGLPASSANATTSWIGGNSSVSVCTA